MTRTAPRYLTANSESPGPQYPAIAVPLGRSVMSSFQDGSTQIAPTCAVADLPELDSAVEQIGYLRPQLLFQLDHRSLPDGAELHEYS